jgi:hypothetical protein
MWALIAPILGPLLKLGVNWFVKKNSKEMVEAATAKGIEVNTDEIRALIHTAHFGASEAERAAAMAEIQRRASIT